MSLSFKFHEDPSFWLQRYLQNNNDICLTFLRTLTTKHARTGLSLLYTLVCTGLYETFLFGLYYLMNLSFKFYKDPSFSFGDICKTMLTFVWSLIFYVLFFLIWASKFHPSVKIIWNLLEHMETNKSNCSGISENMAPILAHMVLLNRSYSKILL